jgi:hypothetical protein
MTLVELEVPTSSCISSSESSRMVPAASAGFVNQWDIIPFSPLSAGFWPFRRSGWVGAELKTGPKNGSTVHRILGAVIPLGGFSCFSDNSLILFGLLGAPPASLIKAPRCLLVLKYPHRLINHKSSKECALDF